MNQHQCEHRYYGVGDCRLEQLEIYLCKHVIQGNAHLSQLRLIWVLTKYFLTLLLSRHAAPSPQAPLFL